VRSPRSGPDLKSNLWVNIMIETRIARQHRLSTLLIKRIFGYYFLLVLVVTAVQLTVHYRHEKRSVMTVLESLPNTFGPGIATSLWTYNDRLLNSVLVGMVNIPMVTGVQVLDNNGREISAVGSVYDEAGKRVDFDKEGKPSLVPERPQFFENLFSYRFPIVFTDFDGSRRKIGIGAVYSNDALVLDRVEYGFWMLLINSIIGTTGLWILFLLFVNRILQKPIQRLTAAVSDIDLEQLQARRVDAQIPGYNELQILEDAFNRMLAKLNQQVGLLRDAHDDLENRVKERTAELRKLSQAVEQSPNSVIITNRQGSSEYVNPAFCETMGYAREEIIGQTPALLDSDNRAPADYAELWKTVMSGRRWTGECHIRKKNGDRIWQLAAISAITDEAGEITHLIGTQMVIERIKEAEAANQRAREEAEAANRAKSEFLANMSHEIRTPLNSVLGFADLLLPLVSSDKGLQYLDAIRSSGRNLLIIINDILDLSKIESGKMELNVEPIALPEMLKDIHRTFEPAALEKRLTLSLGLAENLPNQILLDEVRLRQIVTNLISNAIKFTESGEVRLEVEATPSERGSKTVDLIIQVTDTGIGIPDEAREIIFESFRQQDSKTTRRFGGTGLGLSITRRLLQLMGGRITVQSEVGKGSRFRVELKAVAVSEAAIVEGSVAAALPKDIQFRPARVLVVDDVTLNRELIVATFGDQPLVFLEAANGQEALDVIRREKPDLVLMDIRMPIMDGREALKRMREDPALKQIPVIALTASVVGKSRDEIIDTGFDGFVAKPVAYDAIVAELSRFLSTNENRGDAIEPHGEKADSQETIVTAALSEALPQLVTALETDLLAQYRRIAHSNFVEDIAAFADRLRSLGQIFGYAPLIESGEALSCSADRFDVERMRRLMNDFPQFVAKTRQLMETSAPPQRANP